MKLHNILLASLLTSFAGLAMAQSGEGTPPVTLTNTATASATTSRAEVLADLSIYRESGLLDLERGNRTEFDTPAYEAATKRYQALRNSSSYAQLVRSYASKTGEKVAAATRTGAATEQQ